MAGTVQPLVKQVPIVNTDGSPTEYFIRLFQEKQIDISKGITKEEAQVLIDEGIAEWASHRDIIAGTALTGGGNLSSDVTLNYAGGIANQNDVDLSTPPTDQQVLVWDDTASKWVPDDQSGSGGGWEPWVVSDTGTGSSQVISLPVSVSDEDEVLVFVNGIRYETSEYSVSGTTLTLTTNSASDSIQITGVQPTGGGGGGGSTPSVRAANIALYSAVSSVTVNWPTGTIAGDLVILFHGGDWNNSGVPTGWTEFNYLLGSFTNGTVLAKEMTAADITAGSVTLTLAGSGSGIISLVTVIGTDVAGIRGCYGQRQNPGTTSFRFYQAGSGDQGGIILQPVDLQIGFAMNRGASSTNTFTNGTVLQTVSNAAESGSVSTITAATIAGGNFIANFSSAGTGMYSAVIGVIGV